ncbi:hypothetical protein MELLADRAFT_94730 [Melampsora larici-populina 98AG31]|uniref:Uncharacterized protein n=1 Tax=Melampsora larici-populina (strain 98AG31 / pathotype 3-4-7) TaxID=747676 RepID=F4S7R1_MELLP|nr:hypothetical protein MELLADRAFT_94730 [Melampsora larici-populina 98AG31]
MVYTKSHIKVRSTCINDPSAGSPTETLLRLLLPLNDQVRRTFTTIQSVVATGGVYKGQGRNQRMLMTYAY